MMTTPEQFLNPPHIQASIQNIADVIQAHWNRKGHLRISVEQAAKAMRMSKRSLQRYLQKKGCTWFEILDMHRCHYAMRLFAHGDRVGDVAERLGYKDHLSLNQACKRWLNMTASTVRQACMQIELSEEDDNSLDDVQTHFLHRQYEHLKKEQQILAERLSQIQEDLHVLEEQLACA